MLPEHVGIIPDGNRRLARRLMKRPWKGHEWGIEKIKSVLEWCSDLGVKTVTFYLLSLENLEKRPKRELDFLFNMASNEIRTILTDKGHVVNKNKVRLNFFGRLDMLPKELQKDMTEAVKKTSHYRNYNLNLAIAYGGRQEIMDATRRIAKDAKKGLINPDRINEETVRGYLWVRDSPDPDMIIRTGGEKRLSNFMPFQSVYSELVFIDKMWPELTKEDFARAIKEFGKRQRRFGK